MLTSALAIIHISVNPVLIQLGGLSIHWYGVMYALAFAAGYRFGVLPYLLPRGFSRQQCEHMLLWTIVVGLLGARVYFVVQQPNLGDYLRHPIDIIAVWQGGMDFFGAIFAAIGILAYFAWQRRHDFWLLLDAGVLFAVIGQPIGRIGNIINGDILGGPSTLPWATAYDNPHAVLQTCCRLGVAYQPAGAYEALCTVAIGIGLFWMLRRGVKPGVLGITYVGAYAVSQFLIFYVRQSEPVIGWGLKQSQWTCLAMLVLGIPLIVALWLRTRRSDAADSSQALTRAIH